MIRLIVLLTLSACLAEEHREDIRRYVCTAWTACEELHTDHLELCGTVEDVREQMDEWVDACAVFSPGCGCEIACVYGGHLECH